MHIREGLTFDDLLLVPQYSEINSRSEIDTSVSLLNNNFKHPIIPANMKTVTGLNMADSIVRSNGLAILHRFMPIDEQYRATKYIIENYGSGNFAVSVGIKPEDRNSIAIFYELGVRIFCIDIAHGDSKHCVEMTLWIKNNFDDILLISGNVATGQGACRLWDAGADIVKVGIGPGSLCTTRIETGNGMPQLSALMEVKDYKDHWYKNKYIIADGGIKNAGDIVKALCFADMVMVGNLFAGTNETPGPTKTINGQQYKDYVGSSTHKTNHIEGVSALVPCKGSAQSVLDKLLEGLRSGCSYQGCRNLSELKDNPVFIRITNAGLKESHPHDVIIK